MVGELPPLSKKCKSPFGAFDKEIAKFKGLGETLNAAYGEEVGVGMEAKHTPTTKNP